MLKAIDDYIITIFQFILVKCKFTADMAVKLLFLATGSIIAIKFILSFHSDRYISFCICVIYSAILFKILFEIENMVRLSNNRFWRLIIIVFFLYVIYYFVMLNDPDVLDVLALVDTFLMFLTLYFAACQNVVVNKEKLK